MRTQGRRATPLTDEQLCAVRRYLDSDLSLKEVAVEFGITVERLRYWVAKYRKENVTNNEQATAK